jgi:CoA-transferase family III
LKWNGILSTNADRHSYQHQCQASLGSALRASNSTEVVQFSVARGLVRIVIAFGVQQKLAQFWAEPSEQPTLWARSHVVEGKMASETDAISRKSNRGILAGVRIVECGEGVSAAFATKMMADLGADVIKVESLEGDTARKRGPYPDDKPDQEKSGQFLYLNNNKRGTTLNLVKPEGRRLLGRLLAQADIFLHNIAPRERGALQLESKTLSQEFPNLIIVGISPFGDQGPYRDWKAYALNLENAGGMAFLAPGASQYPELPPLKAFGQQAEYQGGIHA